MSKEKKTSNHGKAGDHSGGRRHGKKQTNYVDSFRWGFVDGEEHDEVGPDGDPSDAQPAKRGTKRNQRKKTGHNADVSEKKPGEAKKPSGGPASRKAGDRQTKPNESKAKYPLFVEDEDDDDLNLPSYGRTPIPTDDELPALISAKTKAPARNDSAKARPEPRSGNREPSPPDRRDKNKRATSAAARPPAKTEPSPETGAGPAGASWRHKKEQMVWDPDRKEYVPLTAPEPSSRQAKKSPEPRKPERAETQHTESKPVTKPSGKPIPPGNEPATRSLAPKPEGGKSGDNRSKRVRDATAPCSRVDRTAPERRETPPREAAMPRGTDSRDRDGQDDRDAPARKSSKRRSRAKKTASPPETTASKPSTDRSPARPPERTVEPTRDQSADKRSDAAQPRDAGRKRTERRENKAAKKIGQPSEPRRSAEPCDATERPARPAKPARRGDVTSWIDSNDPNPADIESETKGFAELGLSDAMLETLKIARYLEPTPIQAGVFKQVQAGRDLMGQAQTGTGKTAAFCIPIIEGIEECPPGNDPVALILVPTRELAVQVRDEAVKLSFDRDVRITACYGGKPIASQIAKLRDGVDVIVGTPGRILDLMNRRALLLEHLRWVVLDEADRMLDIGFRPDIEKILKRTPAERQTLLFSATLPGPVVKLAEKYMKSPEVLDFSDKGIAVETIEQFYITVDPERKFDALVYLLREEQPNQAIIFTRTKRGADRLARLLTKRFDGLAAIHGDLSQGERDRVMGQFRAGKLRYLVATDVVGRGIDVSGISHIINYDIPKFCDDYVHRVGRTGRMGREGVAYTFVTVQEGAELTRIEMRIDKLLKRADLQGFESFSKPVDPGDDPEGGPPPEPKPVFGKPVRKIRRAL